ncbi:hypothetical protein D5S17_13610 [Pseudonocardiaceae bacterium YIM PH 21723]|nr:hypothetical protein D5S17_13610 [Pseudonocardiaceae bacterium YIM PH 21723]
MATRSTLTAALFGCALVTLGVTALTQVGLADVASVAQETPAAAAPALQVSKTADLNPDGEKVTVTGTGYNLGDKGIYVAVCVVPKPGEQPTPCIGGGNPTSGKTAWLSNQPGATGKVNADGTFKVDINAAAVYGSTDCRQVTCAMVTKRDHYNLADREWDVLVPLTFKAAAPEAPAPAPEPAPAPAPEAEAPKPAPVPAAPAPAPARDQQQAQPKPLKAAARSLSASKTKNLNPDGETITVNGSGYDVRTGIYLAICKKPASSADRPTPCIGGADTSGKSNKSRWITNNKDFNPPLVTRFNDDGSFSVTIDASASYGSTDCRKVECVLATYTDHYDFADRSNDVLIPVTFKQNASDPDPAPEPGDNNGGQSPAPGAGGDTPGTSNTPAANKSASGPLAYTGVEPLGALGLGLGLVIAGAGALVVYRRRLNKVA